MTESNKGRVKCADEAQAVCVVIDGLWGKSPIFNDKKEMYEHHFDFVASALHQARLIHGSIYDEHGRIEDKDVAQEEYEAALCDTNIFSTTPICEWGDDPQIYNNFIFFGQNSTAVGTIFY